MFIEIDKDNLESEKNKFIYTSMLNKYSFLYHMTYNDLKEYLLSTSHDNLKKILKDKTIKRKLINPASKDDFMWLVRKNHPYIVPYLLDEEGLKILSETNYIDKLNAILTSNNKYVDKLFKNDYFNEFIVKNFDDIRCYLYIINSKNSYAFIKYCQENKIDNNIIIGFISSLNSDSQEAVVKSFSFNKQISERLLIKCSGEVSNYIINNLAVISSLSEFSFNELYELFRKDINVPYVLLNDKKFIANISKINDVKDYRFLVDAIGSNNDISDIELRRKEYYDNILNSYNKDSKMLDIYDKIYKKLLEVFDKEEVDYQTIETIIKEFYQFEREETVDSFVSLCYKNSIDRDFDKLKKFFINESNIHMSNIIIDYHFEQLYANFLIDVKQLVDFQKNNEVNNLFKEQLYIYEKLVNIDSLSYDEKIKLHEELKSRNIQDVYYDDFRNSKDLSYQMIKDSMITDENINKYFSEEDSLELGVPIYKLEGEDFFALVKSLKYDKLSPLSKGDIIYPVDAASFSLDGSDKLNTFGDPREYYNILYTDFNIDQVVHIYPVDSYSKYIRNSNEQGTDKTNYLLTPKELLEKGKSYNEIIIVQKNSARSDEVNKNLDIPKIGAIYCYDEICENDIISAKNLGIGIVLVNTKKYEIKENENAISIFDNKIESYVDNIFVDTNETRRNNY